MSPSLFLLLPFLACSLDPVWPVPSLLWRPPQESLPATGNYVYINSSSAGCSAGAYLYTPANASLTVHAISASRVEALVEGDEIWTTEFETAQSTIRKGYYEHADYFSMENNTYSGFLFHQYNRGKACTVVGGWFAVDSVTYEEETLIALEIRFEANRNEGNVVRGAIKWSARSLLQSPGPVRASPDLWSPPVSIPELANFVYIALPTASQVYTYTSPQDFIYIEAHENQLRVRVIGEEQWSGSFRTMRGLRRLEPGYYGELLMTSHSNPVRGSMTWGLWTECHKGSGWYSVDSIEIDSAEELTQLTLRFGHICEGQEAPTYGAIYWQANNPVNPTVPQISVPEHLWSPPSAFLAASGNSLYLQSQANLGANQSHFEANWTDALFQVQQKAGELLISVEGDLRWTGVFRDSDSDKIKKAGFYGLYRHFLSFARKYSGFKWEGLLLSNCVTYEGWYVIDEIAYSDGVLSLLRLRFEQFCGQMPYPLQGALYWSSSSPQRNPTSVPAPPLDLWTPPNVPEVDNFLYLESEDEEMLGGKGQIGCVLGPDSSVFYQERSLNLRLSCNEHVWQGKFVPKADQLQLEKGYYGELMTFTDYFNPLKGSFDFSREESVSCYPRTGWFAVDDIHPTASVVLRFETKCENRPALKGYVSWNLATRPTFPALTCAYCDFLWRPLAFSLPTAPSFLHLENQFGATLAQSTVNVTVSWGDSVIMVDSWSESGRLHGTFQLNSALEEGCYDGGVCWDEKCASEASWFTIDRVERQGERLSRLELRFEQRSKQRRGALQWTHLV